MTSHARTSTSAQPRPTKRPRARLRLGATIVAGVVTGVLVASFGAAGSAAAAGAQVDLATAAPFSVLGGQTVTNTGPSTLGGSLGVSPGTAITGFPPGHVDGATHASDAVALQAQSDLTIAYNDAAGRAKTASVAGDLVGQTKIAGVYKSSGPLALSGTLTLDGQGDPNSVFIFQVASTLITASASYVKMINGAQACNVFWQVGSSATLGTHSVFRGSIMALTSISVTTGTVVQGRALARNGAVTLDNDTFASPECGSTTPASATATTITASPTTTTAGGSTTVTATVTTAGGGATPTGSVVFTSGGVVIGTAPLDNTGHAHLNVPVGTKAGTLQVSAHYSGSLASTPSTSAPIALVVRAARIAAPIQLATPTATATNAAASPTASPAGSTTVLASTGNSHLTVWILGAAALLALGVDLTWVGTRRRRYALHRR